MLIYGYRTSHLRTEPVAGPCPACATPDALRTSVFGRYAHVYWVPLLPIGKTGASECGHCQFVIRPKEMEPALRQAFRELKQRSRVPWWHFAGLLLALGIGLAIGLAWPAYLALQQTVAPAALAVARVEVTSWAERHAQPAGAALQRRLRNVLHLHDERRRRQAASLTRGRGRGLRPRMAAASAEAAAAVSGSGSGVRSARWRGSGGSGGTDS